MRINKQAGFNLIELVVAMGFSLAVLASVYGFFRAQTHTTKGQESRMEAHEYAMSVLDTIVREIRNTGYFPNNGTPCTNVANTGGIVAATADSFRLVYDAIRRRGLRTRTFLLLTTVRTRISCATARHLPMATLLPSHLPITRSRLRRLLLRLIASLPAFRLDAAARCLRIWAPCRKSPFR